MKVDLPEGIYFGLDDARYHADVALGSGDMKRLATNPNDFWWNSRFNPNRPAEKDTPAKFFGRAVHVAVLDGMQAFRAKYRPCDAMGSTRAGIAERDQAARLGMIPLPREDFDHIALCSTHITANPHLKDAFTVGEPEVSVFWYRDGIKRKARIDFLKPVASVDLKSIRNSREIDFKSACRSAFAQHRHYVQAEHYREGREAALEFIRDGRVALGDQMTRHPDWAKSLLANVSASGAHFATVFVYWQAEGAPLTWAIQLSPGNPILAEGRLVIERAEANWREFMDRFGPDTPWVIAEPPEEADAADFPAWSFR